MPGRDIQGQAVSITVLGRFNPQIIQPLWLSTHGLVAETEALASEPQMITGDFAQIGLPWADVMVIADRLQVQTSAEIVVGVQIRDLVVGILSLLPHTPVSLVSVQNGAHVGLASEAQWHAVGDLLAPKEVWRDILEKPGMFDIAIQGVRPDDRAGAIKVRVRPSHVVHPGIFVNINEEFLITDDDNHELAGQAAGLLTETWPDIEARVESIRGSLLDRIIT
jgi:hypothetical protein